MSSSRTVGGGGGVGLLLQAPIEVTTTANIFTTLSHPPLDTPVLDTQTAEALMLTYTPTTVGSTTFIRATIHLGAIATAAVGAGLWLNSESATRSWSVGEIADVDAINTFSCWYRFAHTNTNLQTWRLRFSRRGGSTCWLNRAGAGPRYGGTMITSLEIREIQE